jgi:hypothetical protein
VVDEGTVASTTGGAAVIAARKRAISVRDCDALKSDKTHEVTSSLWKDREKQ